jgi:hypothetical protein
MASNAAPVVARMSMRETVQKKIFDEIIGNTGWYLRGQVVVSFLLCRGSLYHMDLLFDVVHSSFNISSLLVFVHAFVYLLLSAVTV